MTTLVLDTPAINSEVRYSGPHGQIVEIVEDNPIRDYIKVEDVKQKRIITIHDRALFLKMHTALPDSPIREALFK